MPRQRSLALATVALVAAALVFSYTLARALTVGRRDQVAEPAAPVTQEKAASTDKGAATKAAAAVKQKALVQREQLSLAVENDPFQSDRMRPSERYRMPGEAVEEEPPPPEPPPPPPNFRVVGTIATPQGGVAVVETNDAGTRVVGIGEVLSGFTLSRVNNRGATVEGNGRSYSLQIEEPSMRRPTRAGRAGGRGPALPNMSPEIQQRLREQIDRLRQNGAPPQLIEQLMQQMNGGRGGAGEALEVIRGANGESQFIIRPRQDTMTTVRFQAAPPRRNNN